MGKLLPLRSALVFGSAQAALEYEAAKAALLSSAAMGARALHEAHEREEAQLRATEARLAAMGVNTGALRPPPFPTHTHTTRARRPLLPTPSTPTHTHTNGLGATSRGPPRALTPADLRRSLNPPER